MSIYLSYLLCVFGDAKNRIVRSFQPKLRTDRKQNVRETVNAIKISLQAQRNNGTLRLIGRDQARRQKAVKGGHGNSGSDGRRGYQKAAGPIGIIDNVGERVCQIGLSWNDPQLFFESISSSSLQSVFDLHFHTSLLWWGKLDKLACHSAKTDKLCSSCEVTIAQR